MKKYIRAAVRSISEEPGGVKLAAAKNPRTSPQDLAILAEEDDSVIQCHVASNPNTPYDVLSKFITSHNTAVRQNLAKNSKIPENLALLLASDFSVQVRNDLADNSNISNAVFEVLSTDPEESVLVGVFQNENVPKDIKEKVRRKITRYTTLVTFYCVCPDDVPLSEGELHSHENTIRTNEVVSKYPLVGSTVYNEYRADGEYLGYCMHFNFYILDNPTADLIVETIKSLVMSWGDDVEDCFWDINY